MNISNKDRDRIRSLAGTQAELAASQPICTLRKEWEMHARFDTASRPMIRIELGTFRNDVLPPLMKCEGEAAREIEMRLLSNIVNHMLFGDDTLVRDHIGVTLQRHFKPFNLDVRSESASSGIAYHFIPQIRDLEKDFEKLQKSTFDFDMQVQYRSVDAMTTLFGDLLPTRIEGGCSICAPSHDLIQIMSMEDLYASMYDYPELFHKMMCMLTDDYVDYFTQLEQKGLVRPAASDEHLYQGSYCFADELPKEGNAVKLMNSWLYMDAQEAVGISPAMFHEFLLPYYKSISDLFGLVSFGCCEPVHGLWDGSLETMKNLRKISVSPWCDEQFIGERLRNRKIVYLRKPTPNLLGVGTELDEDAVRRCFDDTVAAARGCPLEIAQRDVYTINNSPDKVRRYVELARRSMDKHIN